MAAECVLCGRSISSGIVCEKCDKPRKPKPAAAASPAPPAMTQPAPASSAQTNAQVAVAPEPINDPFPKAPVVPFRLEATSLAMTNMYEVLAAGRVPAVLLTADRTIKYVSDEARELLNLPTGDAISLKMLEARIGSRIPEGSEVQTGEISVNGRSIVFTAVPLAGGANGTVVVFRFQKPQEIAGSSMMAYVRETVLFPLRSLREALSAGTKNRRSDPLLDDAVSTIDQILASAELAPGVEEETSIPTAPVMAIREVFRNLTERFTSGAEARGVRLQTDMPEEDHHFADGRELETVLGVFIENSLHYVPQNGQIIAGMRTLDHKGRTLLLFFVMDNGPIVPEELRDVIFSPDFVWRPNGQARTGRMLALAREFAIAHGGQVWVESKTGKACTFFLRVRPDE